MGGNVCEWCSDEYRKTMNTGEVRKQFPALEKEKSDDGTPYRVLRGGSWISGAPSLLLSSCRGYGHPAARVDGLGFRVVCVVGGGG